MDRAFEPFSGNVVVEKYRLVEYKGYLLGAGDQLYLAKFRV